MPENFLLTDKNVAAAAPELISRLRDEYRARLIVVEPGEQSKSLDTLAMIWQRLSEEGGSRASTLLCVGGGMITDLGGFAAACFKRGIRHINVSTTLLGAVDASIGGKTGIDFLGLKNEIGAFRLPASSSAAVESFATLPPEEILSGWGEAVKTALISSPQMTDRMMAADPLDISASEMEEFVAFCRSVKERIVEEDPQEKGLRKVLNLGHTAGHAFESLLMERATPVAHGINVAHGLLVAMILSHDLLGLPSAEVSRTAAWLRRLYPRLPISCRDFDRICDIAARDKKNPSAGEMRFVLLKAPGEPAYDVPVERKQLLDALDLYATMI